MTRRTSPLPFGTVLVTAVLATTLLGACADDAQVLVGQAPDDPGGRLVDDDPPEERDPDILVSVQRSLGGMAEVAPGNPVPDFELRADGTVFAESDSSGTSETGGRSGSVFGIDRYRLTDEGVDRVRRLLAEVSFDDADYGEATITDAGTAQVYADFGEPVGVSVYALDHDSGVSRAEAAARVRLVDVLDALEALATDEAVLAEPRQSYTPDVLDIAFQPAVPEDGDTLPEPVAWPLDEPLTERTLGVSREGGAHLCTTVAGADAAAIAELVAATSDDGAPWSSGATPGSGHPTAVFATVRGLLPGDEGCSADQPGPATSTTIDVDPLGSIELADPAAWDGRLPADRFEAASSLDVYTAVPILVGETEARATAEDEAPGGLDEDEPHVATPDDADLSWYGYRTVVAEVGGQRYLDVEASYEGGDPDPWQPRTWRARIDLHREFVIELQLD